MRTMIFGTSLKDGLWNCSLLQIYSSRLEPGYQVEFSTYNRQDIFLSIAVKLCLQFFLKQSGLVCRRVLKENGGTVSYPVLFSPELNETVRYVASIVPNPAAPLTAKSAKTENMVAVLLASTS